jgi:CelD/BcsL family acetyltransferase involved in cellulose biosynthesis
MSSMTGIGASGIDQRTATAPPPGWRTELVTGTEPVLARVRCLQAGGALGIETTAFQTPPWLAAVARARGRMAGCEIGSRPSSLHELLAVEVSDPTTGTLAAFLPLTVERERALRVARVADIGVSDYRAPILGRAAPTAGDDQAALWRRVRQTLQPHADLVRFEAMPALVGGRPNPFAAVAGATRSRLSGMSVTVDTSVDQMLRDRGKKFRKEVERCFRLLDKEGPARFQRAMTPEAIAQAYAALEAQQSRRHENAGTTHYVLDQPLYSHFYRDLLLAERDSGFARIFTLEVGSETVAVLMGLVRDGAFTLLRISNGGKRWRHLSPGRLVVVSAMRLLVAEGVRTFDMGAGDYPFKRGFGAEEMPLFDLVAALSARGLPSQALARGRSWVRDNAALAATVRRILGRPQHAPAAPHRCTSPVSRSGQD